jgi:hypothetical protein
MSRSTTTDPLGVPDVVDVDLAPSSPSSPQLATRETATAIAANDQAIRYETVAGIGTSNGSRVATPLLCRQQHDAPAGHYKVGAMGEVDQSPWSPTSAPMSRNAESRAAGQPSALGRAGVNGADECGRSRPGRRRCCLSRPSSVRTSSCDIAVRLPGAVSRARGPCLWPTRGGRWSIGRRTGVPRGLLTGEDAE